MSWATSYNGSNNIHFSFPAIMQDGRIFSSWQPTAAINNQVKKDAGIKTNWDYRNYLQHNASELFRINYLMYSTEAGIYRHPKNNITGGKNTPYIYKSVYDTNHPKFGYSNSSLKNPYLSREQLQAKMISPSIYF